MRKNTISRRYENPEGEGAISEGLEEAEDGMNLFRIAGFVVVLPVELSGICVYVGVPANRM
jgi:hypothetical protein